MGTLKKIDSPVHCIVNWFSPRIYEHNLLLHITLHNKFQQENRVLMSCNKNQNSLLPQLEIQRWLLPFREWLCMVNNINHRSKSLINRHKERKEKQSINIKLIIVCKIGIRYVKAKLYLSTRGKYRCVIDQYVGRSLKIISEQNKNLTTSLF